MIRYLISTGTVTFAIKGRDVLRKHGINARVEKTASGKGNAGCGYAIAAVGNIDLIEKLLKENGIKILDITKK